MGETGVPWGFWRNLRGAYSDVKDTMYVADDG